MNREEIQRKYFPQTAMWILPAFLVATATPWCVMLSAHDFGRQLLIGYLLLVPSSVLGFLIAQRLPRDPVLQSRSVLSGFMRIIAGLQGGIFVFVPLLVLGMQGARFH